MFTSIWSLSRPPSSFSPDPNIGVFPYYRSPFLLYGSFAIKGILPYHRDPSLLYGPLPIFGILCHYMNPCRNESNRILDTFFSGWKRESLRIKWKSLSAFKTSVNALQWESWLCMDKTLNNAMRDLDLPNEPIRSQEFCFFSLAGIESLRIKV